MATRSAIGMQFGSIVKAVYCHWDGYPEGVGALLQKNYNRTKTAQLISKGNLSSLGKMIEPNSEFSHTFENPQPNVCTFYGRDRGELDNEYIVFDSAEEYKQEFGMSVEYLYLITNEGNWLFNEINDIGSTWSLLIDRIESQVTVD